MVACSTLSLLICVVIVTGYTIGYGSSLHLEASPESFNAMVTNQLDLTCTADGPSYWANKVVTLEIMKMGETPIVVLSNDGALRGPNWKDKFEAQGIIRKDAVKTFLKLTIKQPTTEDTGTYECLMYSLDESYKIKESKVTANVPIANEDMTVIVRYLLNRISTLERNDNERINLILDQRSTIRDLSNLLKNQTELTKHQVSQLKETIKQQNISTMEANVQMKQLKTQLVELQEDYSKVLEDLRITQNQTSHFQDHFDKESSPIAFSFGYNNVNKFKSGQTLIFSEQILNLGGAYNGMNGMFKAPRDGLYVFHLMALSHINEQITIDLKSNDQTVATLYARDTHHADQSSVSTVVTLKTGDILRPVVKSVSDKEYLEGSDHYSVFTGYLLKSL